MWCLRMQGEAQDAGTGGEGLVGPCNDDAPPIPRPQIQPARGDFAPIPAPTLNTHTHTHAYACQLNAAARPALRALVSARLASAPASALLSAPQGLGRPAPKTFKKVRARCTGPRGAAAWVSLLACAPPAAAAGLLGLDFGLI
jgi:hypothetical protein